MTPDVPVGRDIVLIGGGHAHVSVLKAFGMRPEPGVRLTLITRDLVTPYSGMLPGLIAGHYSHAETHIDLLPLARFARARLYQAAATGLDLGNRLVKVEDRPPVSFDALSIDVGSTPDASGIAGAERALPIKPVDDFLERWPAIEARARAGGPFHLVVIGGGAAGCEISLCLRYRLAQAMAVAGSEPTGVAITVVADTEVPLPGHAPAVRRTMRGFLAAHGVGLQLGQPVAAIEDGAVSLADGTALPCDAAILCTHAAAPEWLGDSGLMLDEAGFVRVGETLQSLSHGFVFAAGDAAAFVPRRLAKSGVFAVRQGPILAENLRRAATDRPLKPYRAQRRTLALITSGERHALASYGNLALGGDWVWRLKDWIDRRWMRKYQELPKMAEPATVDGREHATAMRCGGCGAKVASPVLRRVLARLAQGQNAEVVLGLEAADDAAVLAPPAGKLMVQTVDHFRAFVDDPYLFGRITVNHCLGDIYAMGAVPRTALAMVSLPYAPEAKLEADLGALLQGAVEALAEAGAVLIGGHTGEGAELAFGLSVNGEAEPGGLLRKSGMQPGDALLLSKPLGTGAIFAADMRGEATGGWVASALRQMQVSNREAARCLAQHGATAATDITGFGLLGHLIEMLNASGVRAELDVAGLPALPGALELIGLGIVSSLQPANEVFAEVLDSGPLADTGRWRLLFDPQTAGGLLASVPADRADACLRAMQDAGYENATVVGRALAADATQPQVTLLR